MNNEFNLSSLMVDYSSALKILKTELEILSDEFEYNHKYNPVEHIKCRIKSYDSIVKKLEKKGLELTNENVVNYINDVVGVRVVCSFIPDVFEIVKVIENSKNIKILSKKDYINNPKDSGYSSFHLIVSVPVNLSTGVKYVKAEIQIRTIAMDFWASLDHKIRYKFKGDIPNEIQENMYKCALDINDLDQKMVDMNNQMRTIIEDQEII